jgi:hypothetical protein
LDPQRVRELVVNQSSAWCHHRHPARQHVQALTDGVVNAERAPGNTISEGVNQDR